MTKPTSGLMARIIDFVLSNEKVNETLRLRNDDPDTRGDQINCAFLRVNPNDPTRSGYRVSFEYRVRPPRDESSDDVSVLVEVTDGEPPTFRILNVQFF